MTLTHDIHAQYASIGIRLPLFHIGSARSDADRTELYSWCTTNCVANFYFYPSWRRSNTVQFEDESDMVQFVLVWG